MRTLLVVFFAVAMASAQELKPLRYNHPGLAVDLGVGLWAWPIPADADGDGDFDLIVSCPDKPSNGIWFFENTTGDTAKNSFPIFQPAKKLSSTVHYVMPSYTPGGIRVLSPDREYTDFFKTGTFKHSRLPISAKSYKPQWKNSETPRVRHNQWRYVDFDGDGHLDIINAVEDWSDYGWDNAYDSTGTWTHGPLHGLIFWHRNTGTDAKPSYAKPEAIPAAGKPIDVFGCPSPNFVDFDHDGDLDLLCGEFLDGFTYFENIGTRTKPQYSVGQRLQDSLGKPLVMNLQMIVPIAFDWNRDGEYDLVVGDEDGRVALLLNTGKRDQRQCPVFAQPQYFQQVADTVKCGALATPIGVDWDADGDQDILSGNTAGYIEFFENLSGPNVAEPKWAAPKRLQVNGQDFRIMAGPNGSIQGPAEAKWGYTTFSVADWDGDELPDIVLNSILGEIVWLKNIGTKTTPKLQAPEAITVLWNDKQPALAWGWKRPQGQALLTQWRTTPVVIDWNHDGLPDLVMLDHEGYLAYFERTTIDGQRRLKAPQRVLVDSDDKPLRFNAGIAGRSGRRKLTLTDWDGDGKTDILLNSKNADVFRGLGQRNGQWKFAFQGTLAPQNIEGHDVSPSVVDFDGDTVPDFLGGAEDGRLYFLRNPRSERK